MSGVQLSEFFAIHTKLNPWQSCPAFLWYWTITLDAEHCGNSCNSCAGGLDLGGKDEISALLGGVNYISHSYAFASL
jgi:hypothetical protein